MKLWREMLDRTRFISALYRLTGNQFDIVGIQVAGSVREGPEMTSFNFRILTPPFPYHLIN